LTDKKERAPADDNRPRRALKKVAHLVHASGCMRRPPQTLQSAMHSFVAVSSQLVHFSHRRICISFICAIGAPQHRAERQTFFQPKNQRLGSSRFPPTFFHSCPFLPVGQSLLFALRPTTDLLSGRPFSTSSTLIIPKFVSQVPRVGVEPTRRFLGFLRILSPVRLPIPPPRRIFMLAVYRRITKLKFP
jgi:hypothetical protein